MRLSDTGLLQGQGGTPASADLLAVWEPWGLSRVKITRCLLSSSCWVPPPPPLGPLWPALFLCLGQAGRKTFGSAPCLSRGQHYQGSRLVSSISRCLSLLRSQVSSQDFLALGKIECLSEPSRPVFHLQPPGSDWVTALALPVSPSPSAGQQRRPFVSRSWCFGGRRLRVSISALRPGFTAAPAQAQEWHCLPRASNSCLSAKARMSTPKSPAPNCL